MSDESDNDRFKNATVGSLLSVYEGSYYNCLVEGCLCQKQDFQCCDHPRSSHRFDPPNEGMRNKILEAIMSLGRSSANNKPQGTPQMDQNARKTSTPFKFSGGGLGLGSGGSYSATPSFKHNRTFVSSTSNSSASTSTSAAAAAAKAELAREFGNKKKFNSASSPSESDNYFLVHVMCKDQKQPETIQDLASVYNCVDAYLQQKKEQQSNAPTASDIVAPNAFRIRSTSLGNYKEVILRLRTCPNSEKYSVDDASLSLCLYYRGKNTLEPFLGMNSGHWKYDAKAMDTPVFEKSIKQAKYYGNKVTKNLFLYPTARCPNDEALFPQYVYVIEDNDDDSDGGIKKEGKYDNNEFDIDGGNVPSDDSMMYDNIASTKRIFSSRSKVSRTNYSSTHALESSSDSSNIIVNF